jgi:hypothetical protein
MVHDQLGNPRKSVTSKIFPHLWIFTSSYLFSISCHLLKCLLIYKLSVSYSVYIYQGTEKTNSLDTRITDYLDLATTSLFTLKIRWRPRFCAYEGFFKNFFRIWYLQGLEAIHSLIHVFVYNLFINSLIQWPIHPFIHSYLLSTNYDTRL